MVASIPVNLCLHKHPSIVRDTFEALLVGTKLLHILYISELYYRTNCIYIPRGGL